MTHHDLKCDPVPFAAVASGQKLSELRFNDRDFQSGDTVTLREWDAERYRLTIDSGLPENEAACVSSSGRTLGPFTIGHVLREGYGLKEGWCMFGLMRENPA